MKNRINFMFFREDPLTAPNSMDLEDSIDSDDLSYDNN